MTARSHSSLWRRLRRLGQVATNIRYARRVTGSWTALVRQLARARSGGLRDVYGSLIGLVALGGRGHGRWYRQWLERLSPEPAVGTTLAVVASFDTCERLDYQVEALAACVREGASPMGVDGNAARRVVFVNADASGTDAAVRSLAGRGVAVTPTRGDFKLAALPDDCAGLVFLGARSCPAPEALAAFALALAEGAQLAYGDADEIDARGRRCRPRFKPDFSLDLFLYEDYVSDCFAVSRELIGELPPWDFDDPHGALLRWLPSVSRIAHVPKVLSHALAPRPRPETPPTFLPEFLRQRFGDGAGVEATANATGRTSPMRWRCRFGTGKTVTVVVPTRDRVDLLDPCIDSVYATNDGTRLEVLIVDNGSSEPATRAWFETATDRHASLRVLADGGDFNWSRLNNLGIEAGAGDVFVFLNNDTLATHPGWLGRLAEYALRDDAGAVGPLLLFADGSIQHAGLVVGFGDHADHLYRGTLPGFDDHAFVSPLLPRNVAAVTGACLAASRKTIQAIGGFDERLRLAGDVEFCLRAHGAGLATIYAADVVLKHYESGTIGRHGHGSDGALLGPMVAARLPRDPFYNPNLTSVAGVGRGGGAFALLHEDTTAAHLDAVATSPPSPPAREAGFVALGRRPPVDDMLDIVFFWKQNDTGIYGRRQDMLVKYLARHARVRRIFHYDAPIDLRDWLRHPLSLGIRASEASVIVRQTLRRKLHLENRDNIRFDTFTFLRSRRPVFRTLARLLRTESYPGFLNRTFRRHNVGARRTLFWACPTVFDFPSICDRFAPDLVVADVIDDQRKWPTTPEHMSRLQQNYEDVLARSDLAFANCAGVLEAMGPLASNMHLVPNAAEVVDEDSERWPKPVELRRLAGPVIGYVGNLDAARLDVGLIETVAIERPDWHLVFIGSARRDNPVLTLARLANVHLLGVRRHSRALRYIRHFDVAMIPHLDNDLTRNMNPLKLYVYFSLGVPVVATPIANTDAIGAFVETAGTACEFIDRIERCLGGDVLAGRRPQLDELLREHSWSERVRHVMALVDQALKKKETASGSGAPGRAET